MNTDFIYWTFTAAAQCVASFVALLLTGYALVLSQIEAARDRDETLQDIHHALRRTYHARLTVLAWLTATAVLLSLLVVWLNRSALPPPNSLMATAASLDLLAIVAGLAFVVAIIDPGKYQKAAERELEAQQSSDVERKVTTSAEFFRVYRKLEKVLRDQVIRMQLAVSDRDAGSLRQMAELLHHNESIDDEFYKELLQITKYRNLLFHGDVAEADFAMVERIRGATTRSRQMR
jgi:uncharacterized protein YutE (UPF0331/DUF86 family)